MANEKYLDTNGLTYFWTKLKPMLNDKVDKVAGMGLSTNDYTTAEKNKLAGIETGANNYVLPAATSNALGGIKVGTNLSIDNNGVLSATDTTYTNATTATAGLMSSADKQKLDTLDVTSVYQYKGSVATYSALPASGNHGGDVWNVEDTGQNYAWNGSEWDGLGGVASIDSITNAEIDAIMV